MGTELDFVQDLIKSELSKAISEMGVEKVTELAQVNKSSSTYAYSQYGKSDIPLKNFVLLQHGASRIGYNDLTQISLIPGQKITSIQLPKANGNTDELLSRLVTVGVALRQVLNLGDENTAKTIIQELESIVLQARSEITLISNRYRNE